MKIALSIWKDCISTFFDTADQLLVLDSEGTNGLKRTMIKLTMTDIAGRATEIKEKKIDILICGAISRQFELYLASLGIQVYPFVRGSITEVFDAYQNGKLNQPVYVMPGCRRRMRSGNRMQNRCGRKNWI